MDSVTFPPPKSASVTVTVTVRVAKQKQLVVLVWGCFVVTFSRRENSQSFSFSHRTAKDNIRCPPPSLPPFPSWPFRPCQAHQGLRAFSFVAVISKEDTFHRKERARMRVDRYCSGVVYRDANGKHFVCREAHFCVDWVRVRMRVCFYVSVCVCLCVCVLGRVWTQYHKYMVIETTEIFLGNIVNLILWQKVTLFNLHSMLSTTRRAENTWKQMILSSLETSALTYCIKAICWLLNKCIIFYLDFCACVCVFPPVVSGQGAAAGNPCPCRDFVSRLSRVTFHPLGYLMAFLGWRHKRQQVNIRGRPKHSTVWVGLLSNITSLQLWRYTEQTN